MRRPWPRSSSKLQVRHVSEQATLKRWGSRISGPQQWCGIAPRGSRSAPGLGWQDLRTITECLTLAAEGIVIAPNESATKYATLIDAVDPDRQRDLCVGTVDSWVVWTLTEGAVHITDPTNAGMTGLVGPDGSWQTERLGRLRIPESSLPHIVASTGVIGEATALPGSPPIAGVLGDQQSSLIGQGCVHPGLAKVTFGTGGMVDVCTGEHRVGADRRTGHGAFPIAAWGDADGITWGLEGILLAAGTNVEWLRDDLGLITTAADSDAIAASVTDTDGVVYVPALLGLGTPYWDFGARSSLLGVTRGTTSAHIVRAVLEGVAHLAVDVIEAVEADLGSVLPSLRVDGGMSVNSTFVQALADAAQRPIEVASVADSTSLGAGFCAGLALGTWGSWDDIAAIWRPAVTVDPGAASDRARWAEAVERSRGWHPDLSALDF